jgi:hypothetical protein
MFGTLEGNEAARNFAVQQMRPVREFLGQYINKRQLDGVFKGCNVRAMVAAILAMPSQHATISELFGIKNYEVSDSEAIETFTQTALDALYISGREPNRKIEVKENV